MTQAEEVLMKKIREFTQMDFFGKKVAVPYWKNEFDYQTRTYSASGPFGGKGTPRQIYNVTLNLAQQQGFDLKKAKPEQIREFMQKNHVGLDCSGFAYQLLDALDMKIRGLGVDGFIKADIPLESGGDDNYGIKRVSAKALTNETNTIEVESVSEIKTGDLIRMKGDEHLAVVIAVTPEKIAYAHSEDETVIEGPHVGKIMIKDIYDELQKQDWTECLKDGKNFQEEFYNPQRGDSVRRLKLWL